MLELWKWNTVVFALQALAAGIAYYFTGDLGTTAAAFAAAAFAAAFAVAAAAFAAVAAAVAAAVVKDKGAKEPLALLFIAALPLGIGTVFGGLLYLWWRRRERTAQ